MGLFGMQEVAKHNDYKKNQNRHRRHSHMSQFDSKMRHYRTQLAGFKAEMERNLTPNHSRDEIGIPIVLL